MHSFSFNNVSLSTFGGNITKPPFHTVAKRDKEMVKIYGQNGDEIIDNGTYNNVTFSMEIALFPKKVNMTAQALAYAVIDWLAPLQNDYYVYRDTYNPNYFTRATLTNFPQVERTLRTLLTATLEFSRVPFWYSDAGAVEAVATNGRLTLTNPEKYDAEPVIFFNYTGTAANNYTLYLYINNSLLSENKLLLGGVTPSFYLDGVNKQHYTIQNNQKIYLSNILPPNLAANSATAFSARMDGQSVGENLQMKVTPNWRRL